MKNIGVVFALFVLAALLVVPVAGSGNYSASNPGVERILAGAFVADGSPRLPLPPPPPRLDGSPRPPFPPTAVADGSPRPPFPPTDAFDGSLRPPFPPTAV